MKRSHVLVSLGALGIAGTSTYQRVKTGRRFTMMSPTLPVLFDNPTGYRRVLSLTPHGVLVAETSTDEKLTAVLRAHARKAVASSPTEWPQ
jgi:hypothetical protein